jgi:hypothetical protein
MRSLKQDEVDRVRRIAAQHWRGAWVIQSISGLALASIFVINLVSDFGWQSLIFLTAVLVLLHPQLFLWLSYREWRRHFDADLAAGVVVVQSGKVYDRFWNPAFFTSKKYTIWAEGVSLQVDRRAFQDIQIGDTIEAQYLPRSGLLLAYTTVARA